MTHGVISEIGVRASVPTTISLRTEHTDTDPGSEEYKGRRREEVEETEFRRLPTTILDARRQEEDVEAIANTPSFDASILGDEDLRLLIDSISGEDLFVIESPDKDVFAFVIGVEDAESLANLLNTVRSSVI